MTMTPQVADTRIRRELVELEAALNRATACAAALAATAAVARSDLNLGPAAGHAPLLRLAAVQTALIKAGADTARVHEGMLGVAREMGIADEECDWISPSGAKESLTIAA